MCMRCDSINLDGHLHTLSILKVERFDRSSLMCLVVKTTQVYRLVWLHVRRESPTAIKFKLAKLWRSDLGALNKKESNPRLL